MIQIRLSQPTLPPPPAADEGMLFQIAQPAITLLNYWQTAQSAHNTVALRLLRQRNSQIRDPIDVTLEWDPERPGAAPLSWHLTAAQKDQIERGWTAIEESTVTAVRNFLDGKA